MLRARVTIMLKHYEFKNLRFTVLKTYLEHVFDRKCLQNCKEEIEK